MDFQWEIACGLGMGACGHFFIQLQDPIWYRPMLSLCRLPESLCIPMHSDPADLDGFISLEFCISLSLTFFFTSLPQGFLSHEGKNLVETTTLEQCVSRSLILYMFGHWSMYLFLFVVGRSFLGWWLSKARIYGYSRISLGLFSFSRTVVFCLTLDLWTT